MIGLSRELMTPWMKHRLQMSSLQRSIRTTIGGILKEEPVEERATPGVSAGAICQTCPSKKRRMTTN
ncbi:unnamed protein product [Acanthoscelides obtectus]|uniref:Uncharacterized protein n=1 Tax=Acanthoscelides obtectus TaxID=200917 RepID=A0A9P0MAS9_ACAOB|nr:unnamed protein product [Acanthoscelides obtectus]CAK1623148.1 hypothetical protein AOBTE_LOCUS1832 [Acanthoscelides obtectus]